MLPLRDSEKVGKSQKMAKRIIALMRSIWCNQPWRFK